MSDATTTGQPQTEPSSTPTPGMPTSAGNKGAPGVNSNGVPWQRLFIAAIVLVAVYLAFALAAFARANESAMSEVLWSRSVWVLQGVEAVAFTAIGWLFGREVHRGEAEEAKQHANDAKKNADDAKQEAKAARSDSAAAVGNERGARERAAAAETAGWRLAEAIRARAEQQPGLAGAGGDERSPAGPGTRAPLASLKDLADTLFPPS